MCEFRKQPVSPPMSDSEMLSDGERRNVSLLSSMLSEHSSPAKSSGYVSGPSAPSAPSTAPSTAFSSPRAHDEPISILRRSSVGSDELPFTHLAAPLSPVLVAKEPLRDSDRPSAILLHEPLEQTKTQSTRRPSLKFAVAQPRALERTPRPVSDDEGEAEATHSGYEEDSEDGFSDDEPNYMVQAMARAREARLRDAKANLHLPVRPASTSPPRVTQPPPRRGRGHIRVDPAADKDHQQCSRHCSPPPSDARSTRSAPPGPRDGRAGSPVPSRHSDDDDDDDDEDDDQNENEDENEENEDEQNEEEKEEEQDEVEQKEGSAQQDAIDDHPHEHAILSDSDAEPTGLSAGVRNILRRASEHLPSFRRPSFTLVHDSSASGASGENTPPIGRSRSLSAQQTPLRMAPLAPLASTEDMARSQPLACPRRVAT